MTEPKFTRIHNITDWKSYDKLGNGNVFPIHNKSGYFLQEVNKEELIALGFVELPTTDTGKDWIDEVIFDYERNEPNHTGPLNGDYMKKMICKHMPKPVEQVLMPLDIHEIIKEIKSTRVLGGSIERFDNIRDILSKYGVHKQEEETLPTVTYHNYAHYEQEYTGNGISPAGYDEDGKPYYNKEKWEELMKIKYPTTPVTSTIEELVDDILFGLKGCGFAKTIEGKTHWDYKAGKEKLKQLLSSYNPTSKKYTREELWEYTNNYYETQNPKPIDAIKREGHKYSIYQHLFNFIEASNLLQE